jgi:hypothetical protein
MYWFVCFGIRGMDAFSTDITFLKTLLPVFVFA